MKKFHVVVVLIGLIAALAMPAQAADDVALLHGNSLPITDVTGRTWTNSDVTVDNANKVFGDGALNFNGSAYLSAPDNPDSHFGDGRPMAMDFWVRLTQLPANQSKYVVYSQGASITNFMLVELYNLNGVMGLVIEGSNQPVYAFLDSFDANEWHHLAIQKESVNDYRLYQNCQELDATGVFSVPYADWSSPVYIGQFINGGLRLRGQLDEFYLTRTVRFTGSSCDLPDSEYGSPVMTATPTMTPTITFTPTTTRAMTATPTSSATPTMTPFIFSCVFPLVAVDTRIDPQTISLSCE